MRGPSPQKRQQVQSLGPLPWAFRSSYVYSSMPPPCDCKGRGVLFIELLFHRPQSGLTVEYAGPASSGVGASSEGLRRFLQDSLYVTAVHGLGSAFGITDEQRRGGGHEMRSHASWR